MKNDNKMPESFEAALEELDAIVNELELGDIELEKSLVLFERGIVLSNYLKAKIEDGKTRIKTLAKQDGAIIEKEFIAED